MSKFDEAIDACWDTHCSAGAARCVENLIKEGKAEVAADAEKLRGDLHHLINPIIGVLRRAQHYDDWDHLKKWCETYIERLNLVLNLVDEAVVGTVVPDEIRGKHGVGLNHYPSLIDPDASPCVSSPHGGQT